MKLPFLKKESKATKATPAFVFDFGTESVKILLCNYIEDKVEMRFYNDENTEYTKPLGIQLLKILYV